MAVVLESKTHANFDNAATGTIAYPTSIASGDFLLLLWSCDGTRGIATPSAFTSGSNLSGGGGSFRSGFHFKVADGTETGNLTIDTVSGNERAHFTLIRISGAAILPNQVETTTGNSAAPTFASITPSVDDCIIIQFLARENGQAGAAIASAWTSPLTEYYDNDSGPPGTGTGSSASAAATLTQTTAATRSGDSVTSTQTAEWRTFSFAIAPSADALSETITVTGIDQVDELQDSTTIVTGSFTPNNNSLLVAIVLQAGTNDDPTSVAGGSLTWTKRAEADNDLNDWYGKAWIYTAPVVTGASMTVTATMGSEPERGFNLLVAEIQGHDVDDPIIDTLEFWENAARNNIPNDYTDDFVETPTTNDMLLAVGFCEFDTATNSNVTGGYNWTEIYSKSARSLGANDNQEYILQYRTNTTDTTVNFFDISSPNDFATGMAAIMIRAGASGSLIVPNRQFMHMIRR